METKQLAAQLLKSREIKLAPIGRFTFTIRRPTEMELIRLRSGESRSIELNLDIVQSHVIGWAGVLESDIVADGASDAVPFDPDLYRIWIEEHPDLWAPLISGFGKAIEDQAKKSEALAGNSKAPSTG